MAFKHETVGKTVEIIKITMVSFFNNCANIILVMVCLIWPCGDFG